MAGESVQIEKFCRRLVGNGNSRSSVFSPILASLLVCICVFNYYLYSSMCLPTGEFSDALHRVRCAQLSRYTSCTMYMLASLSRSSDGDGARRQLERRQCMSISRHNNGFIEVRCIEARLWGVVKAPDLSRVDRSTTCRAGVYSPLDPSTQMVTVADKGLRRTACPPVLYGSRNKATERQQVDE